MERAAIGVAELDNAMLGGIPKGSLVLVLGPPGAGKSILSKLFLYRGASNGEVALLLSTAESESIIRETFRLFNWNGIDDKLSIIDCYSWRLGKHEAKNSAPLTSLTEVSLLLSRRLGELSEYRGRIRFVLDSFSDFVKYSGVERSIRFLDSMHSKLREMVVSGLVLLEEGMHAQRTVTAVEYSTDGTLRMRLTENGRYMMVSRMVATPIMPRWIPFVIGK